MNSGGRNITGNSGRAPLGAGYTPPSSSPDKVFGSIMPDATTPNNNGSVGSGQIYGNKNYTNQTLRGKDVRSDAIIDINHVANGVGNITPQKLDEARRRQAMGQDYNMSTPLNASNPNQAYMQAPPINQSGQPLSHDQFGNPIYNSTPQNNPYYGQPNTPLPSNPNDQIDYLNSITPKRQKKSSILSISPKLFLLVGGIILAASIVVSIFSALLGSNQTFSAKASALGNSLANLQEIVIYGKKNRRYSSVSLVNVTAEANLIIVSKTKQLSTIMPLATNKKGQPTKPKPDKDIIKVLDDAKASGKLPEAYRKQLLEKLEIVKNNLNDTYKLAKAGKIRQELKIAYQDVTNIIDRTNKANTDRQGTLTGKSQESDDGSYILDEVEEDEEE